MKDERLERASVAKSDRIVIERGGRRTTISLPRHGVFVATTMIVLLGLWSAGAAAYVFFHDTVVAEIRGGAQAAARGYDVQIAALRDELERSRTRGMVERTGVTERLGELLRRQQELEKRQARLAELAEPVERDVTSSTDPAFSFSQKPMPLDQHERPLDDLDDAGPHASLDNQQEKVASALDALEAGQVRTLEGLAVKTGERRRTLESVYDAVHATRPGMSDGHGRGGPYEPLPAQALTFDARADEIETERAIVQDLDHGLNHIPLRTPAPGALITSGFGARSDPFLGRPAFHAGIDFEEQYGETVKATAAGRVTVAGWTGGYGNMVEIDHGGGFATRFGHMSSIAVVPGQEVRIGSVLGRVGSTGRSTGPHLHYETRINGAAVDPIRFLNAGRILARAN